MKYMKKLCATLTFASLVFSTGAFAADDTPTWEFSGASNASFTHTSVDKSPGSSNFVLETTADYFVLPALELGIDGSLNLNNSNGSTQDVLALLVGPVYNFLGPIPSAFFVGARAGISNLSGGGLGYTSFAFEAFVGKRFEIASHVSWAPEVGVLYTGSATIQNVIPVPSTTTFVVTPFRFSILF